MYKRLMLCLSVSMSGAVLAEDHNHHEDHSHALDSSNEHDPARANHQLEKRKSNDGRKARNRQHGAHVHGQVTISLAMEGTNAKMTWESPAESIYGFEHAAKTDADKKKQAEGLAKLENEFFTMFAFSKSLGCKLKKFSHEVEIDDGHHSHDQHHEKPKGKSHRHQHSTHSEVKATFDIACKSALSESEIQVDVGKVFSTVKVVQWNVVSATKQDSKRLEQGKGSIKL